MNWWIKGFLLAICYMGILLFIWWALEGFPKKEDVQVVDIAILFSIGCILRHFIDMEELKKDL